jgi:penicillin-binding protein 1A
VFANGGFLIDPYFIDSVVDRDNKQVYKAQPVIACRRCPERAAEDTRTQVAAAKTDSAPPVKTSLSPIASAQAAPAAAASSDPNAPKLAPRVLDARIAYLIGSLLHDVVRRGTGHDAMVLKRNDLAGKTGSTNDHRDAWFSGYNDALVASVWVGFDDFSSLGRANGVGEFGAQAALPMWIAYMRETLKGVPEKPFEMPAGIATARIDPATGQLAPSGDEHSMLEMFKQEDVARLASGPNSSSEEEKKVQQDAYGIF